MPVTLGVTEAQIYEALRAFLASVLPTSVKIIRGQQNRVSEPQGDFVVMASMFRNRLSTNVESYADAAFIGSVAGTTLTVTSMLLGQISIGSVLFGVGVSDGTTIASGSQGSYQVSTSQTIPISKLACGSASILQPTQVTVQLDVHGPNAPDNAQIISTLFRDGYATDSFDPSAFGVSPLYADDPKQMPFVNAEQQYEYRWVVTAVLQADQAVTVPQQFADQDSVSVQTPVNDLY